jgi:hypothetical protein
LRRLARWGRRRRAARRCPVRSTTALRCAASDESTSRGGGGCHADPRCAAASAEGRAARSGPCMPGSGSTSAPSHSLLCPIGARPRRRTRPSGRCGAEEGGVNPQGLARGTRGLTPTDRRRTRPPPGGRQRRAGRHEAARRAGWEWPVRRCRPCWWRRRTVRGRAHRGRPRRGASPQLHVDTWTTPQAAPCQPATRGSDWSRPGSLPGAGGAAGQAGGVAGGPAGAGVASAASGKVGGSGSTTGGVRSVFLRAWRNGCRFGS